jgi:hypothetical protein
LDAVQLTNESDAEWNDCEVTLEGGFSARAGRLGPRDTVRLAYRWFRRDGTPMSDGEGVWRAKQQTALACSGSDGRLQRAARSFP